MDTIIPGPILHQTNQCNEIPEKKVVDGKQAVDREVPKDRIEHMILQERLLYARPLNGGMETPAGIS
jgi:hypothetical protein